MKVHIKRSFDSSSSTYDSSCDIQRLVARHLAELITDKYENILEIGAGTGVFTDEIACKFPSADVTCVDISQALLNVAKEKHPHYKYICADGENLSLKNGGFDLLASSSTFQWFAKPEKSIPELINHLKPGGKFAFSIFAEGTFAEMSILNKMTGFGSVYNLRPDKAYMEILKGYDVKFETREYVLWFDTVKQFLKKQKGTGATFTGASKFTSKTSYQKFIELYPELFGENGKIPVTYKIFYCSGTV
ncbi:MAG: hypothetical protein C0602_01000 [Denitrovibrio sp.]|nr:MAG: hypothetical protein C0602_01000 [Denitrovibrio sp.]